MEGSAQDPCTITSLMGTCFTKRTLPQAEQPENLAHSSWFLNQGREGPTQALRATSTLLRDWSANKCANSFTFSSELSRSFSKGHLSKTPKPGTGGVLLPKPVAYVGYGSAKPSHRPVYSQVKSPFQSPNPTKTLKYMNTWQKKRQTLGQNATPTVVPLHYTCTA